MAELVDSGFPIWNFDYPIFTEEWRQELEDQITYTYYNRRICVENPSEWQLMLCMRMRAIMPYYNELYRTTLLEFDPLSTQRIRTSTKRKKESEANRVYGSEMKERQSASDKEAMRDDVTFTSDVHTDEHSDQTDWNLRVDGAIDVHHGQRDTDGTIDYTEDTTERKTAHSTTDTAVDSATDTITESQKTTDSVGTLHSVKYDYPGVDMSAVSPSNPGGYASGGQTDNTTGQIKEKASGTEDVSFHSDTESVTDSTENTTGHKKADTITHETQITDTKDTHDADSEYDGTIEFDKTINVHTDSHTHDDRYTSKQAESKRTSDLSTAEMQDAEERGHDTTDIDGYFGTTPPEMISKWRSIIVNVTDEIVVNLSDLFYGCL